MKKNPRRILSILALLLVLVLVLSCTVFGRVFGSYTNPDGSYVHLTGRDSFRRAEQHPAFAPFSSFILPWKDRVNQTVTPWLSLSFVCRQNRTSTDSITDGLNFIIDRAEEGPISYDFYTDDERRQDPSKEETGLIVLPGDPDKPLALLTSGGAFQSVCLFLEGFPVGRVLHEMGYSVAILKYRVDPNAKDFAESEANCLDKANEDFARALDFLFAHQSELGVSMEDYSVWGFSAGGRTTSLWALDNSYGYAAHGLPKPAAMVLVYSGWYDPRFDRQYGTAPATFFAWLPEDDVIGEENMRGIQTYIDLLKAQNTPVETVEYHTAKHGFGEGRGTDAEGWIQLAADFWQRQQEN